MKHEQHNISTETKLIDYPEFRLHGEELLITINSIADSGYTDGTEIIPGDKVVFDPPVVITCYKATGSSEYSISWDFGMGLEFDDENGASYGIPPTAEWKEKAEANAIFDIEHAFFHTAVDPNYGPIHYAILGCLCLRGRAKNVKPNGDIISIEYLP